MGAASWFLLLFCGFLSSGTWAQFDENTCFMSSETTTFLCFAQLGTWMEESSTIWLDTDFAVTINEGEVTVDATEWGVISDNSSNILMVENLICNISLMPAEWGNSVFTTEEELEKLDTILFPPEETQTILEEGMKSIVSWDMSDTPFFSIGARLSCIFFEAELFVKTFFVKPDIMDDYNTTSLELTLYKSSLPSEDGEGAVVEVLWDPPANDIWTGIEDFQVECTVPGTEPLEILSRNVVNSFVTKSTFNLPEDMKPDAPVSCNLINLETSEILETTQASLDEMPYRSLMLTYQKDGGVAISTIADLDTKVDISSFEKGFPRRQYTSLPDGKPSNVFYSYSRGGNIVSTTCEDCVACYNWLGAQWITIANAGNGTSKLEIFEGNTRVQTLGPENSMILEGVQDSTKAVCDPKHSSVIVSGSDSEGNLGLFQYFRLKGEDPLPLLSNSECPGLNELSPDFKFTVRLETKEDNTWEPQIVLYQTGMLWTMNPNEPSDCVLLNTEILNLQLTENETVVDLAANSREFYFETSSRALIVLLEDTLQVAERISGYFANTRKISDLEVESHPGYPRYVGTMQKFPGKTSSLEPYNPALLRPERSQTCYSPVPSVSNRFITIYQNLTELEIEVGTICDFTEECPESCPPMEVQVFLIANQTAREDQKWNKINQTAYSPCQNEKSEECALSCFELTRAPAVNCSVSVQGLTDYYFEVIIAYSDQQFFFKVPDLGPHVDGFILPVTSTPKPTTTTLPPAGLTTGEKLKGTIIALFIFIAVVACVLVGICLQKREDRLVLAEQAKNPLVTPESGRNNYSSRLSPDVLNTRYTPEGNGQANKNDDEYSSYAPYIY